MAKFYPSIGTIKKVLRPKPKESEIFLLSEIEKNFSDNWSVIFKTRVDGILIDIIMVHQAGCIILINTYNSFDEIKINTEKIFFQTHTGVLLEDPFKSLDDARKKLLGIIGKNKDKKSSIIPVIYSHETSQKNSFSFNKIYSRKYENKQSDPHIIFNKANCLSVGVNKILSVFKSENYLTKENFEKIYNILKYSNSYLNLIEPQEICTMNKKQELFSISNDEDKKIRGVAGSGKTLVLAKRAVNAYKRTGEKVLYLCYNITMVNYISEQIETFLRRENLSQEAFEIIHFHKKIANIAKNVGVSLLEQNQKDFKSDDVIFDDILNKKEFKHIEKYRTIIIDEAQDFKYSWLKLIKKNLLKNNGEYVIAGDKNQNIYDVPIENDEIKTNILGAWSELNISYRLNGRMKSICNDFQKAFMDKPELLEEEAISLFDSEIFYMKGWEPLSIIISSILKHEENVGTKLSDIVILTKDNYYNEEIVEYLKSHDYKLTYTNASSKSNFLMSKDELKITTIYSFKGWESDVVILILDTKNDIDYSKIIYTGLTRAKLRLYIVDSRANNKYTDFFREQVKKGNIEQFNW